MLSSGQRIFVSHSHFDNEFGMQLAQDLRHALTEDNAVFYDVMGGLHGGETWWEKIVEELTARDVFLLILSPDAMNSLWVRREINIALHQNKFMLPVLHRTCDIRPDLKILQIISFLAPKRYEQAFQEILLALHLPVDTFIEPKKPTSQHNDPAMKLIQQMEIAFTEHDWPDVIRKAEYLKKYMPAGMTSLVYRWQGVALIEEGEEQQAQEAFQNALALVSDRQERLTLLNDYTALLVRQQQWAQVLQRAREALRLVPHDPAWQAMQQQAQDQLALHVPPTSPLQNQEKPKNKSIQPQPSLYDVTRDPPDFNEREQREHPHMKFYPERGKSWTMQSGWNIWNIIGASRRGYGHAYDGKYREDDFEIRRFKASTPDGQPTMIMVAIADGVSSNAYSRRGARAAVRGATSISNSTHLQNLATYIGNGAPFNLWQNAAFNALLESLSTAHDFVEQQAKDDRISIDEMQSTLLVYLAVPLEQRLFIASVQVGDGALFALQPAKGATPGERWKCLQRPQIQTTGNEVQPFMPTGPDTWQQYLQAEVLQSPTFIMGMTDGTANDIEPPRPSPEVPNPDPFYFVDDFYRYIATGVMTAPQPAEALLKFLDYRKKQSFDDRTVVCLYR